MKLDIICIETRVLVKQVGQFITEEGYIFSAQGIKEKGKQDFVTYVDKSAEEKLVKGLRKILPEAGFITEEGTDNKQQDIYNWIIDPLDGTTNFIHGSPPYAISVALNENKETILGVVYEITHDECFYSWKGAKAYLDNEEINVSKTDTVAGSLIATGFPYNNFDRMEPFMRTLNHFFLNTHGVRRLGSAATDLAYVACGRYDAFYEYNLKSWDVAAGAFLVQQAGGKAGDFSGGKNYLHGREVVASNTPIFDEFQKAVFDIMGSLYA